MPDLLAQVRSMLATSADRWAAIARADADLLARQPEPGEWSALQALQHVVDTEIGVFQKRLLAIRDGAESFAGFDPEEAGHVGRPEATAPELAATFAPLRAATMDILATLDDGDLVRTSRHEELGIVTMSQLLNQWAAHDTMHIVQAERALMQAFIPASGPWRHFFVDHDVELKAATA